MKKIITAIGEQKLNEELRKYDILQVVTSDIQYKEGILEVLENEKDIDIVIFNEEIQGEIEFEDLIDTIKLINRDIEIIIILKEQDIEKMKYLKTKNITKTYLKNEFNIEEIVNSVLNVKNYVNNNIENNTKKIEEKNIKIDNKIEEKNDEKIQKINIHKNNIVNLKIKKESKIKAFWSKIRNSLKKKKIIQKVITISGIGGVGKSVFTANLANSYANGKNRVLIVDFDILNSCIHTLFGVKKYPKNVKDNIDKQDFMQELISEKTNIKKLIVKINNKVDLISGIDIILNNNKLDINELHSLIEELKKDYNIILIDTSTECFTEYTRMIMKCSDDIIFLLEGNLLQIKKSINLLNVYTNNWNINYEKIDIIVNKKTNESIDESILKNIFSDFYIIGNIKFSKIYNTIINKNMNKRFINNKIRKEYKKISQMILKEKNIRKFSLEKREDFLINANQKM